MKEPLTRAELAALAKRLGGVRELVAPKRRAETAALTDAQLLDKLAAEPNYVRRPLVDTGKALTAGFTDAVREVLNRALSG